MKVTVSTLSTAVSVLATPLFAAEIRYAYDERRQLTSVVRDGCEVFGYGYDLAGNLLWASIGCKTNVYETNCLNQYTTVTDGDGNVHQIEERGGPNLYAFCRNNPVNNCDPNGCAYFAYRPLNNSIGRKFGVRWRGLDGINWVVAHEQLIFEDG